MGAFNCLTIMAHEIQPGDKQLIVSNRVPYYPLGTDPTNYKGNFYTFCFVTCSVVVFISDYETNIQKC